MADSTIYLDHAATTPVRREAVEAMLPLLTEGFGNPSGAHRVAREARRALEDARETLAALLGVEAGDVVFTSGGTEADSLAVCGVHARSGGTVLCSAIEHKAVLAATRACDGETFPVDGGLVDLEALQSALESHDVSLVSVMAANNEVGTVQPVAAVVDVVRQAAPQALVHSDAVQAFAYADIAKICEKVDLLSLSAHKFGGPPGVGALIVKGRARELIAPIHHGGGQERDLRSGTHNVAGIAAMAVAAQHATAERAETASRVGELRDAFEREAQREIEGVTVTASDAPRLPSISHLHFAGVETEELLLLLDRQGVAASAGSACSSGAARPSHVLLAMGMDPPRARSCVRFSLGRTTTETEIDAAVAALAKSVETLRA